MKIPDDATVTATVGIGPREDGTGFYIDPSISVNLPGVDRDVAEKLVARRPHRLPLQPRAAHRDGNPGTLA